MTRLGIDFGTSTTVAVLHRPDGRLQQLIFDGSPLLPSAVLLGPDGRLHTGRDAAHLARSAPERLEPNPKRRIDEGAVLLADAEVPVADLVAAVLARVVAEADRVLGPLGPAREAVLTHPADWGSSRRARLREAAIRAGLGPVTLVAEPLAAAAVFTDRHGAALPAGAHLLVYDLGAGTCDVTLLRRGPAGFAPVASEGLGDIGGLDIDAALVASLQRSYGPLWTTPAERRRLWDDVRSAKEMLSRASGTVVLLPAPGREIPLGREQLQELARPVLHPTVAMTGALLRAEGVRPSDVAGLFLVGGASRTPLVATMLHEALGLAPIVAEQPELVVAEGALLLTESAPLLTAPAPILAEPAAPPASAPVSPAPAPAPVPASPAPPLYPARRGRRGLRVALAAAGAIVAFGAFATYKTLSTNEPDDPQTSASTPAAPKYDLTKAPDDLCAQLDLTAFRTVYETEEEPPRPSRNLTGQAGTANCTTRRSHQKPAVLALFAGTVTIRPDQQLTQADYRLMVAEDARVNDTPEPVENLGEEAVVYRLKDSSKRAATDLTLILGVREHNLTWQLRMTATRTDGKGWTAAELTDLRARLVTATRATLPTLTAAVT
ncbi:Hsp70 family protein [Dactylosporangium sp. NPDC049140]|uniref:Hsp70 family protein n=1 Tax=Dactylosporangium sp. NPDC049140 TaxID=3155647 RepID=UPI00340BD9B2